MILKSSDNPKRSSLRHHHSIQTKPPCKATSVALAEMGGRVDDLFNHQDQTTEPALILFDLPPIGRDKLVEVVQLIIILVFLPRVQEGSGRGKMTFIAVGAVPADIKPPAADSIACAPPRVEDAAFGAPALSLTRASPTHFSGAIKRGSAIMPKLVKLVGTLAEEISPVFSSSAGTPSVRLLFFVTVSSSASVARRGCRACCRSAKRFFVVLFSVSSKLSWSKWIVPLKKKYVFFFCDKLK